MNLVQRVVEKIQAKGFKTKIDETEPKEIYWAVNGVKYFIYEPNIAAHGTSLAWFQSSDNDDHLLVVCENGSEFEWIPETYNPAFGCDCIYIGWRNKHLVFIYLEKHDIYICVVSDSEVKHINFHGENLFVGDDKVTYSSFGDVRKDIVNLISLPNIDESSSIDFKEAEKRGIKPIFYQEYFN